MPWSKKVAPGFLTLDEALNILTVDDLKQRVALVSSTERPTRKADLVILMAQHLEGERLHALWERLDDLQQKAVSEAIHTDDGVFKADKFRAKYGQLPSFGTKKNPWGSSVTPSLLRLFFYSEQRYSSGGTVIPAELRQRLSRFVPAPAAPSLSGTEDIPEYWEQEDKHYEYDTNDDGPLLISRSKVYKLHSKPPKVTATVQRIPINRSAMEHTAQQDLQTVLRLIDKGKVAVSDKTLLPSAATMTEIASLLRGGDFYDLKPKQDRWEQVIGPIKGFAWPLLAQAAKLAELHGKKLALTKAGRQALSAPPEDTLRLLWQRWLSTRVWDELHRIDVIKGQQGKGKRGLTAVANRRQAIDQALRPCPPGMWVKFDDFSNFMQAAGFDFAVTHDPWNLYITDAHYGNLGYEGYHDWHILEARYVLCVLFEYAASLGLLDVAYIPPEKARRDYTNLWGTDDLSFLSRYDGLLYFRVNALGAYCLGISPTYVSSTPQTRATLTVLPGLQMMVNAGELSPDEVLFLETYADQETTMSWRLNRDKALAAVERGHQIAELRTFLQERDTQPLPETVEGFIVNTAQRARACVNKGTALLIECRTADIADQIANHARAQKLCTRAGERHLVVPVALEEQFRQALHSLGYGMPLG